MSPIVSAIRSLAGAVFLAGTAACGAINDIVLHLPDIQGESRLERYPRWIAIDSFEVGVTNAAGGIAGAGGRPIHKGLTVVKRLDTASPRLALWCGRGASIPSARLEFTRTIAGAPRFYVIDLAEVTIAAISVHGSAGNELPTERVTLSYVGIEEIYTELRPNGQPAPELYGWWSVLTDTGGLSAVDCITATPASIRGAALTTAEATVRIPPLLNIGGTIGVTLTSSDPTVVSFPESPDGRTLLAFPRSMGPSATVQLSLLRRGHATITLARPGTCVANAIEVDVDDPGSVGPTPVPLLAKVVESGQLRLSWPVTPYVFHVQAAGTVEGPWVTTGDTAAVEGTENAVYLPAATGERYFRLTN